jgi:hypothetical protein
MVSFDVRLYEGAEGIIEILYHLIRVLSSQQDYDLLRPTIGLQSDRDSW